MEWMPIESAPKDVWVLVSGPPSRTEAPMMVARGRANGNWESADDGYDIYMNPTHWMPLPEPPKEP